MDTIYQELAAGMPDAAQLTRIVFRLLMALLLASVLGAQRERTGKPAGLRTHMLVALSSTVFVLASIEAGMQIADLSRVIQGVATGIGFLGAGAILKLESREHITGLTTAAGIWMTAALGVAAGMGRYGLALFTVAFGWAILQLLTRLEARLDRTAPGRRIQA
jgi:putative Mg2+ transporter-C (MgtC) family protein